MESVAVAPERADAVQEPVAVVQVAVARVVVAAQGEIAADAVKHRAVILDHASETRLEHLRHRRRPRR